MPHLRASSSSPPSHPSPLAVLFTQPWHPLLSHTPVPTTTAADFRSTLPASFRDDAHFFNNITVATGNWTATISVLYEYLTFIDLTTGATITSFPVTPTTPYTFGTVLYAPDDFDVMYQVTLVEGGGLALTDKRVCLFVVSGYSAGKPQVMTIPFNGAVKCMWENDGEVQSFRAQ